MDLTEVGTPCLRYACVKCCLNTEMLLTCTDILRISRLGFQKSFFVTEKDGELLLKNAEGRCIFHNGSSCKIYRYRPEGCELYPVVLDMDRNEVTLDLECPYRTMFQVQPRISRRVVRLVRRLNTERNDQLRDTSRNSRDRA